MSLLADGKTIARASQTRPTLRSGLKAVARAFATVIVAPELLSFTIRSRLLGRDKALEGSSQMLGLVPGLTGEYLRAAFLRRVLDHCAPDVSIGFGATFSKCGARIESGVYIGPRCQIGLSHIGRDALLAAGVHVPSGRQTHGTSEPTVPYRDQPGTPTVVRIGEGAWIGSAAVVMADVGQGAIIGAGAVVTRAIPGHRTAAGVPAVVLDDRVKGA